MSIVSIRWPLARVQSRSITLSVGPGVGGLIEYSSIRVSACQLLGEGSKSVHPRVEADNFAEEYACITGPAF